MDPLSALGVAASVAQFVQFASSLVSKSREIYVHGASLDHVECESATKRLVELTANIRTSSKELENLGKHSNVSVQRMEWTASRKGLRIAEKN